MTKNNNMYFKTPSQTVGPFFGNYLNFNLSKKILTNFNEKIDNQIILKLKCTQQQFFISKMIAVNAISYQSSKVITLVILQILQANNCDV